MNPTDVAPASPLGRLPWEIRSVILLDALEVQRRREPVFDIKFMRQRVRLENCFDERHPKRTNIYIEKPGTWPLARSARALQSTSRQLRNDVTILINDNFKTGKRKAPFILDIMIVKDIGVFPTWLCFPYKTKRILNMRVNLRIIRPDAKVVPLEWVELARFPANIAPRWAEPKTPTFWSFFAVLALISLNRLYYKPTVDETSIKSTGMWQNKQQGQSTAGNITDNQLKTEIIPTAESILKHKSSVMDAYLIPIEATPYIVDQLHIDFKPTEYRPNGTRIIPNLEDKSRNSPFYKEGYIQFGRLVFHDNTDYSDSYEMDELLLKEKAEGRVASGQLLDHIWRPIKRVAGYLQEDDELTLYQHVLGNSVGEVTYSPPTGNDTWMMTKNTESWVSAYEANGDWRTMNISKAIATEEASEDPARGYIALLQMAKRRRALGWQAQFDKEEAARQKARREKEVK